MNPLDSLAVALSKTLTSQGWTVASYLDWIEMRCPRGNSFRISPITPAGPGWWIRHETADAVSVTVHGTDEALADSARAALRFLSYQYRTLA
ncbi:hypothetical protein [Streptomyces sp. NPDC051572]|uniref:hypothetical protein n=1 Tax=Streptomyces sp. NPDC051572 TaxID=3155802 RepID=UPI00344DE86C